MKLEELRDFGLSEAQRELRHVTREFARRELAPRVDADEQAGRYPRESAFAQLAGVAPIPASSGQVIRHRLNRGGDRRLNQALHTIVLVRRQRDARTKAYIARRIAEGKSAREVVRCLKRYLARHLFRMLEAARLPA